MNLWFFCSLLFLLCCVVLCSMDRCLFHLPIIRFFIIFIFLIWLFLVKINYYLNLKSVFHFYILLKSWDEIENINFVWIVLYIYMYVFPYYLSISWGGFSKLFPIYIRLYFIYISICNLHVIWCCFYYLLLVNNLRTKIIYIEYIMKKITINKIFQKKKNA